MLAPATRWGSRDAVMVGTRLLALVYAALVVIDLVAFDGGVRLTLVTLAVLSAALFATAARLTLRLEERGVDLVLVLLCLVPLLNVLAHLALTREAEQSAALLLVLAGVGAVSTGRTMAWSLDAVCVLSWGLATLLRRPEPAADLPFYAVLIGLGCLLSVAVLEIRLVAYRRLSRAIERSDLDLRRFRSVFDDSPVGIGLADEHGDFVEANAALCAILGRPVQQVIGHSSAEFTLGDDLPALARAGRPDGRVPSGVASLEARYVLPDGTVRWSWLSFAHVAGPEGQTWTITHMQDVTDRRTAEDELRVSQESMVAAVEIAQATQSGRDPRPVVLGHLRRLAGASFVSLTEPLDEDRLVVTAVDGELDLVGLTMGRDEPSVTTHVWHTGEPVFASQLTPHPLVSPRLLSDSGAASLLWHPVGVPGDLQAVLSIAWDDPLPGVDTAGRAAVEAVAAEAGAALTGERMRRDLERSTVTDTLTGLLNRRGWDAQLRRLREHAARTASPFVLALVDLDHFKRYNDTFGHLAGDVALRTFADGATAALRVVDVLARWGGEEFTIALHATSGPDALVALERVRACASDGLTCSVGYVEVWPGDDLVQALANADTALYDAKESGRDRVVQGAGVGADWDAVRD